MAVIYSYCQRSTYVVVCVTTLYVDQYEMKLSRKNQCSDQLSSLNFFGAKASGTPILMRVFLRCSSVWPIHDRSLALSPPLLAHSCSAMTREQALRIGVYGSSRGSDSRPSERVGKFRAGSGGVPILSYCSRYRRFQDPETRFGLQA